MKIQGSERINLKSAVKRCLNFNFFTLNFIFTHKRAGLTLLEMVVAVGIFGTAMIMAVGIMLGALNANLKSAQIQAVIDNTRFSLELIAREMRTGTNFQITNHNCLNQLLDGIEFVDRNVPAGGSGKRRYYYLADRDGDGGPDAVMRVAFNNEALIDCTQDIEKAFTGDEVLVENFQIRLAGQASGGLDGQPRVTISLKVKSTSPKYQQGSTMNLQTTVVQRLLED